MRILITSLGALALTAAAVFTSAGPAAAVDETGPQVNMAQALNFLQDSRLSTSASDASIPAEVSWTQYDESGICSKSAEVRWYANGAYHYSYPSVTAASKRFAMNFEMAASYRVALTATDCVGNTSTTYGYYYPSLVQQGSANLSAGWTTSSCQCWSGGSIVKSSRADARATYTFAGSIALISDHATRRGTARVYLDGVLRATINLRGAKANRVVVFQKRYANSGDSHTLNVVVSSGRVDVDAFVLG